MFTNLQNIGDGGKTFLSSAADDLFPSEKEEIRVLRKKTKVNYL